MAIVYTVIGFMGVMILGPLVALLTLKLDDVDADLNDVLEEEE